MKNGEIDLRDARLISYDDFREWTRKALPAPGDVVLSRRCNPGETARVRDGQTFALGQKLVLLRSNGIDILPQYLIWMVRGPEWWNEVEKHRNPGAVFDSLKCRDIPLFTLTLPPPGVQLEIASLLGALDDKIQQNRRMAETLEAMARALFKSWFVDFDPVHARAERRPTGLSEDLAALFPDSFGADGIPIGWKREPLLQHAQVISGGTPKTEQPTYWGGPILWASAKDVSQCPGRFLVETERTITPRGVQESATQIVPRLSTVVVARGATTGRHCILGRDMAMNQTCYALTSPGQTPYWMSCAFAELVGSLLQAAHGSVFDTITIATLTMAQVMAATESVRASFEDAVAPLFDRILLLIEESSSLQQLRDTLLPRLISGELRIADAEQRVAAA